MLTSATTELMHTVLDGEASEAQEQALQQLLSQDSSARAEYARVSQLFTDLGQVPQRHPPEGLVAAVMAAVDRNQLSSKPRVISAAPRDDVSRSFNNPRLITRLAAFLRSIDMSDQQPRSPFGNRKYWIGGATAAAALLVWQFGFNSWPVEKDVMGTIAPADRYRAAQPSDIKVGTSTGGQSGQGNSAMQTNAADGAAKGAADGAAKGAADGAAKGAADGAAKGAADGAAKGAADGAAKGAADGAAKSAADGAAKSAADGAAKSAAQGAAKAAAEGAAKTAAEGAGRNGQRLP
ncbi:MAG: hypothetical protein V4792_21140 [Pseudomonadota bacterium]